jgi:hypothetical protein
VALGQGDVPLVLRDSISVFEPEIPGQAAVSGCSAKPIFLPSYIDFSIQKAARISLTQISNKGD